MTLLTLPSFHRDKKVARFPQIAWSDEEFPNAWQMHAGSLSGYLLNGIQLGV